MIVKESVSRIVARVLWGVVMLTCVTASMTGCGSLRDNSLQYVGDSNGVDAATAPAGFALSPGEAIDVVNDRHGPRRYVRDIYHDEKSYYVVNGFKGSTPSRALKQGTIIHGQTGQVYNRDAEQWETDPREP